MENQNLFSGAARYDHVEGRQQHVHATAEFVDAVEAPAGARVETGDVIAVVGKFLAGSEAGRLADGPLVTKLRLRNGRPDVAREYVEKLIGQMQEAARLAGGGEFVGPYSTAGQIYGRICFVRSVRPSRGRDLLRQFRSVPWSKVEEAAMGRGLMAEKKRLVPKPKEQNSPGASGTPDGFTVPSPDSSSTRPAPSR